MTIPILAWAGQKITGNLQVTGLGGGGSLCVHTDNSGNLTTAAADCGTGSGGITGVNWGSIGGIITAQNWASVTPYLNAGAVNWSSLAGNINKEGVNWTSFPATGFMKFNGSSAPTADTATYLTGNQTVILSGPVTGSGSTAITTALTALGVQSAAINWANINGLTPMNSGGINWANVNGIAPVNGGGINWTNFPASGFARFNGSSAPTADSSTYITGNQSITLSGDVSGSGTTGITTAIGALKVQAAMVNWSNISGNINKEGVNWTSFPASGFMKFNGSSSPSADSSTYITGNQTITLSGDVSGSGTTGITAAIGALKVQTGMVNWSSLAGAINKEGVNWTSFPASGFMKFNGSSSPSADSATYLTSDLWTQSGSNVNRSSGNVGVSTTLSTNKLDVAGGVTIGTTYAGYQTAPSNGMAVQGNMGVGTYITTAQLTVGGSGFSYFGGNVGLGTLQPQQNLCVGSTCQGAIDSSGNVYSVGLGTTTAGTVLCISNVSTGKIGYCTGTLTNSICGTCH